MPDRDVRRAKASDLATIQEIARRTISARYRTFMDDDLVDWSSTAAGGEDRPGVPGR